MAGAPFILACITACCIFAWAFPNPQPYDEDDGGNDDGVMQKTTDDELEISHPIQHDGRHSRVYVPPKGKQAPVVSSQYQKFMARVTEAVKSTEKYLAKANEAAGEAEGYASSAQEFAESARGIQTTSKKAANLAVFVEKSTYRSIAAAKRARNNAIIAKNARDRVTKHADLVLTFASSRGSEKKAIIARANDAVRSTEMGVAETKTASEKARKNAVTAKAETDDAQDALNKLQKMSRRDN